MESYKKNSIFISLLFLLSFFVRIAYFPSTHLYGDQAVYAEIIDEFTRNPTPVPQFLGKPTAWKPPFAFALYAGAIRLFSFFMPTAPPELIYRLPHLILGVLSTLAFYFLVRKLYGQEVAFISSVIFTMNPISIATSELLILENLVLFLLLIGITFYIEGERERRYLYLAGLAGALLFLTKSVIVFLLPALAILYYLGNKKINGGAFLISLSIILIAMVLYTLAFFLISPAGKGRDITTSYLYDMVFRVYGESEKFNLLANAFEFLNLMMPWSLLLLPALFNLKFSLVQDRFVFLWLMLTLVFIGASQFYCWYYLFPMLPFSIICSLPLQKLSRKQFFPHIFLLFLTLSIPHLLHPEFMNSLLAPNPYLIERVEAGLFLHGKNGILSITEQGMPETVFYKFHNESNPKYWEYEMKILNPYAPGSYIGFEVAEVAFGTVRSRNITSEEIKNMTLGNYSYVLMDSQIYSLCPSLDNYAVAFNSSRGSYIVLRRVT